MPCHTRPGVHGDTGDVTADNLHLSGVHACADLEAELPQSVPRIDSRMHRARRTVERRQKAVAGRFHLTASVLLEHAPNRFVVTAQQAFPTLVAELTRPLRRSHDVGEQHRRENPVGLRAAA